MKIAIFGNKYQDRYLESLPDFFNLLQQNRLEILVESSFHDYLHLSGEGLQRVAVADISSATDLSAVITLGGDGTLLHTAQLIGDNPAPLLGVNTGHLGYLTTAALDDARAIVEQLLSGRLIIEQRTMLRVQPIGSAIAIASPHALNEIAILRQDTSSMIEMETTLNGVPLTTYKGDGLVVSTPSGSTAYNMSAGGPILEPTTACFVLTPVSPHSLHTRPLVVRDDAVIRITVRSRAPLYQISVDGNSVLCPSDTTVEISRSPRSLRLAQLEGHHFAATLRQKLQWGGL